MKWNASVLNFEQPRGTAPAAGFAAEMVSRGVDLITVNVSGDRARVRQAPSTIPTVFAVVVEPIGDRLTSNLERPGGTLRG
jgi:hypothetical protein